MILTCIAQYVPERDAFSSSVEGSICAVVAILGTFLLIACLVYGLSNGREL
jgi:hypothetical protein